MIGPKSIFVIVAILCAAVAAAILFIPDVPKIKDAVYLLCAGVGLLGVAHFVRD